jgi:hypothetical protein
VLRLLHYTNVPRSSPTHPFTPPSPPPRPTHTHTQGLLHDGMKVLEVTGPGGSADQDPIVTTENLGEPPGEGGGADLFAWHVSQCALGRCMCSGVLPSCPGQVTCMPLSTLYPSPMCLCCVGTTEMSPPLQSPSPAPHPAP